MQQCLQLVGCLWNNTAAERLNGSPGARSSQPLDRSPGQAFARRFGTVTCRLGLPSRELECAAAPDASERSWRSNGFRPHHPAEIAPIGLCLEVISLRIDYRPGVEARNAKFCVTPRRCLCAVQPNSHAIPSPRCWSVALPAHWTDFHRNAKEPFPQPVNTDMYLRELRASLIDFQFILNTQFPGSLRK